MAESRAFAFVAAELERRSHFDRLQARGTVRLALKAAGLKADSVTPEQMAVVLAKTLPRELVARGLRDGEAHCAAISAQLGDVSSTPVGETPDAIFERLGRS